MARHILIAGKPSPVLSALVREAASQGCRVIFTAEPGDATPTNIAGFEKNVSGVVWNRRSPLSARSVILHAVSDLERPIDGLSAGPHAANSSAAPRDTAAGASTASVAVRESTTTEFIVAYGSSDRFQPIHELSTSQLELKMDQDIKGYLFLFREILGLLSKRRGGTLTLVFQQPTDSPVSSLEAVSTSAFRAIGDELFTAYQNEPIALRGFESTVPSVEEFARFVLISSNSETSSRNRGKWLRFNGKSGLFSFVR